MLLEPGHSCPPLSVKIRKRMFARGRKLVNPDMDNGTHSLTTELLSPAEMAEADRRAIAAGPLDGIGLMRNAGQAVAAALLSRFAAARRVHVLCGPGNNGGDGYVVATLLSESGMDVTVWASGSPRAGSDAGRGSRHRRTWPSMPALASKPLRNDQLAA